MTSSFFQFRSGFERRGKSGMKALQLNRCRPRKVLFNVVNTVCLFIAVGMGERAFASISGHFKGSGTGSLSSGWKGSCYFDVEVRLENGKFEVLAGKNFCGDKIKSWPVINLKVSGNELVDVSGEPVGMVTQDSITAQLTDLAADEMIVIHLKELPAGGKVTLQFDQTGANGRDSCLGLLDRF